MSETPQGDQGGSWWQGLFDDVRQLGGEYARHRLRQSDATGQNNQAIAVPEGAQRDARAGSTAPRPLLDSITSNPQNLLLASVALLIFALAVKKFSS